MRGVSALPRAARASRAQRGLAWAQLVASHFLLFNLAKLCYVRVVAMHCVVPSARLTHVCGHILVLATSDCSCGLTRAAPRARFDGFISILQVQVSISSEQNLNDKM